MAAVIGAAPLLCCDTASAAAFNTGSYNVEMQVEKNKSIDVTEKISVDFMRQQHGIFRYIPYISYNDTPDIKVKDVDTGNDPADVSRENNNYIIRIGDEDKMVEGKKDYTISYRIINYRDENENQKRFAVDLIPTGWETSIDRFSAKITMPESVEGRNVRIYMGKYGSDNGIDTVVGGSGTGFSDRYGHAIDVKFTDDYRTLEISGNYIQRGEGLTVSFDLPSGYFSGVPGHGMWKIPVLVIWIAAAAAALLMWRKWGKDAPVVETVEFYPPDGMDPVAVSLYLDDSLNYKDAGAMIVYMAHKGYLTILEEEKDEIYLVKGAEPGKDEKPYVSDFYRNLFKESEWVSPGKDRSAAEASEALITSANDYYKSKERAPFTAVSFVMQVLCAVMIVAAAVFVPIAAVMYSGRSLNFGYAAGAWGASAVSFAGAVILAVAEYRKYQGSRGGKAAMRFISWLMIAGGAGCAAAMTGIITGSKVAGALTFFGMAVAEICMAYMGARSKKGTEMIGRLAGFRNFIEHAEVDRLNMLAGENPEYFYNVLPYAYIFGLTDKWISRFEKIGVPQPGWYRGVDGWDMYRVMWISHMMNSVQSSVDAGISEFVAASSDNGSFSGGGGGFSGGGIGGGGGGSW